MTSSFKSGSDLLTAVPGQIYSFEGATLKVTTPPSSTSDKTVANTEWVKGLLGIVPSAPVILDGGGLNITYTSGTVTNPSTSTPIYVTGTTLPLAVGANSVEYIWVRYLDGAVVASTVSPNNNQGYLLSSVTTNSTNIVSISSNSNATGWAPIFSPSFAGVPTVPTPSLTDNSNKVPTTSWVRSVVQSTLAGSDFPTLSITNAGTGILWSDGTVTVSGAQYPVVSGQYTFTSSSNGILSIYAVVVGNATIVVVSSTAPTGPNALLGTVSVNAGSVGQVNLPTTTGFAPIASPVFTGNPQAPTPSINDSSKSIPTTEWVNTKGFAPIASPVFTGNPQAPTPLVNDRDKSIPTTEWVVDMVTTKMVVGFGGYVTYVP